MLEAILGMANIDPALLAKVMPIVFLVMAILSGAAMILRGIAKFTASDKDDKAASIMDKVIGYAQKLVDILSGNVKH